MNISFLTSICIHRSIILIFIGKKSMLIDFFSNGKYFFPLFSIFISARILVSVTKLANIKIIWSKSKLETKCWFIGPYRIVSWHQEQKAWPNTLTFWMQSLTHISDSRILPDTNQFLLSLSAISELPFVFQDALISDTSAFSPFASTTRKDEIYDQVVGSLSGQVFQSGCHQFASSRNIVDTHTKWPPIRLQSLNGWLASDDWVTSLRCRLG